MTYTLIAQSRYGTAVAIRNNVEGADGVREEAADLLCDEQVAQVEVYTVAARVETLTRQDFGISLG